MKTCLQAFEDFEMSFRMLCPTGILVGLARTPVKLSEQYLEKNNHRKLILRSIPKKINDSFCRRIPTTFLSEISRGLPRETPEGFLEKKGSQRNISMSPQKNFLRNS